MASSSDIKTPDHVELGVVSMIGTVLALSLGDALMNVLVGGSGMGIWQLLALRSLQALLIVLIGALLIVGKAKLAPRPLPWIILRSALLAVMWIAYYVSRPLSPLAVLAAAYYTLPLFIVVFVAVFAGEAVPRTQWIGIVLFFLGILLVLRLGGRHSCRYSRLSSTQLP